MNKILAKLGLTWHDLFIIITLLETGWWIMFAFIDGADVILRTSSDDVEYHPFLVFQKCISFAKLILAIGCMWYGTIMRGQSFPLRIYLLAGVFVDLVLILAWIVISVEEKWPLSPKNTFGVHYIATFVIFRVTVYRCIFCFMREIFVTSCGSSITVTMSGNGEGTQGHERGITVNCANNLVFFGKGLSAVLEYYRVEAERACLISLVWDVLWNLSIMISQEIPELIFDVIFIGIFGSLPLNIPTENFGFRIARAVIVCIGIYLALRKIPVYLKVWTAAYGIILLANVGFFCYVVSSELADETSTAIFILCSVFFASNAAKLCVCFTVMRFYYHLKSSNTELINDYS